MRLDKLFEKAVDEVKRHNVSYAVAGGIVASIYREEYRNTNDIDIIINANHDCLDIAIKIIESLGLKSSIARMADLCGGPIFAIKKKNTEPCIVVGRLEGKPKGLGVDIILPTLLWVPEAVRRAQHNVVDFGFGMVPTITVEDLLIAKFMSLNNSSDRVKDIDDLKSIMKAMKDIDLKYIAGQMLKLEVKIPFSIEKIAPEVLLKISKDIVRQQRKNKQGNKVNKS